MTDELANEMPELKAMAIVAGAFATLEEDEVQRVLKWANEKYRRTAPPPSPIVSDGVGLVAGPANRRFSDFAALFEAARPSTGLEKILVAAYWFQGVQEGEDFDSQSINTMLKNLGHPSANITRDIEALVNRSPKLIIQTRKTGSTQQARKRFRLTTEGVKVVDGLLAKGSE